MIQIKLQIVLFWGFFSKRSFLYVESLVNWVGEP